MNRTAPIPSNCELERHILHGVAATFPAISIDTDAIFPKQFLKTIKRTGLKDALFADWRTGDDGAPNPDFILNKQGFVDAKILIGGDNFGCGSSREHAVWALKDFGIKALVSTSFGSIFHTNCIKNGVWPLTVNELDHSSLVECFSSEQAKTLTVDLANMLIFPGDGTSIRASIPASDHANLLSGLDEIDHTLAHIDAIEAFEKKQERLFPWLVSTSCCGTSREVG